MAFEGEVGCIISLDENNEPYISEVLPVDVQEMSARRS